MLPFSSTGSTRTFHSHSHRTSFTGLLSARSRLTNLGFALLSAAACISILINLFYYHSSSPSQPPPFDYDPTQTIMREPWMAPLHHLIIVPGHAIWKGTDPQKRTLDSEWILETYQKGGGRVQAFYDHIAAGAELALGDESSLLVFSGGQTRSGSTSTEAASYLRLALASNLLQSSGNRIFPRVTTEDYALDSYQNLLFSVARFHEFTGVYPEYITVIGYEMKRKRFEELHSKALRWPHGRFEYIGIDANSEKGMGGGNEGELKNAYLPYQKDLYGCHTSLLSKRTSRNPFMRFHPYFMSAPGMRGLFSWCPDDSPSSHSWWSRLFSSQSSAQEGGHWSMIYSGRLPWD